MDKKTGKSKYIARYDDDTTKIEGQISNDGAVDSQGRFWVGTMADPMDFSKFEGIFVHFISIEYTLMNFKVVFGDLIQISVFITLSKVESEYPMESVGVWMTKRCTTLIHSS